MTDPTGEQLLTVDEAAAILRCHPSTVRARYLDGSLRITRVGRLVRIPHSALAEFLTDSSTTSTTPERTTP